MAGNTQEPGIDPTRAGHGLSDDDRELIISVFHEEIVPKLKRLQARTGNLSCAFAGPRYEKWTVRFTSRGSSFDIADIEYDEDACGIDLDV